MQSMPPRKDSVLLSQQAKLIPKSKVADQAFKTQEISYLHSNGRPFRRLCKAQSSEWPVTEQTAWIQGSAPGLQPEFLPRPRPHWASLYRDTRSHMSACEAGRLDSTSTQPQSAHVPYPPETSQMAVAGSNVLLCENSEPFVKQVLKLQTINQHQFKC